MLPKRHLSTNKTCQNHLNNRDARKDHHTNLIPIPSIKHRTSFPVNYKNDSNIMVERDHKTIIITKQIISLEAKNTELENSKERPLQDQMTTRKKKKKVIIIGDSMIKKIYRYLLTGSVNHKYLVKVRPFLAAKSVDMLDYVKPIQRDLDPEAYMIHIGTNELTTDKTPDKIFSEVLRLIKELKTDKNKIVVSTNVPRGDAYNTKAEKVNTLLKESCENNGIDTI